MTFLVFPLRTLNKQAPAWVTVKGTPYITDVKRVFEKFEMLEF